MAWLVPRLRQIVRPRSSELSAATTCDQYSTGSPDKVLIWTVTASFRSRQWVCDSHLYFADGDELWEYYPRASLKTQDGSNIGWIRMGQSVNHSLHLIHESVSD